MDEDKPAAEDAEAKVEAKAEPAAEAKPEPAAEAKPEPAAEAKPEPAAEAKPEPAAPSEQPPVGVRLFKAFATLGVIIGIIALVLYVSGIVSREPPSEEPEPLSTVEPPDPPLSTVPTPFGLEPYDAAAFITPDDDTVDATAQYEAFIKRDGGRRDGGVRKRDAQAPWEPVEDGSAQ
jgi:hypothetical protein